MKDRKQISASWADKRVKECQVGSQKYFQLYT